MNQINKNKTASFDVDPQNGFTPVCPNELPVEGGDEIADALNLNATKAVLRVASKDSHPSNPIWKATDEKPQFTLVDGDHDNVDIHWALHCVPGTLGFEFIKGLPKAEDYDFVVYKGIEADMHPYGACYHDLKDTLSTGVIEFLKSKEIENVIVGGLATDYCVKTTAIQLKNAGFNVIINLDSCRGIDQSTIDSALIEMKELEIVIVDTLDQITLL